MPSILAKDNIIVSYLTVGALLYGRHKLMLNYENSGFTIVDNDIYHTIIIDIPSADDIDITLPTLTNNSEGRVFTFHIRTQAGGGGDVIIHTNDSADFIGTGSDTTMKIGGASTSAGDFMTIVGTNISGKRWIILQTS